VVRGHPRSSAT